jgi:hypothetical protein
MTREIICPGIDDYMKPFFSYFNRSESRELAENYVTGLLLDGERKSVEPMSEKLHASERSMQRLLSDVKWDDKGVAVQYRRMMLSATADPLVSYVFNSCFLWQKICRLLQTQVSSKVGNNHHLFQLESQSNYLQPQFGEVIFVSVANFFDQTMNMESFELTGNL